MQITYSFLESIFNTLSISYYLGRPINAKLSKNSIDSFYSPEKDLIIISAPSIAMMLYHQQFNKDYAEEIIRGLLYHEVSHVILTGKNWINEVNTKKEKKCFNIFEDERIETLFMNMYYNTNFKKNIILLNNYQGQAPKNADEAWYFLVRFHAGEQRWLDVVENIIDRYMTLNAESSCYEWRNYIDDIMEFYDDFCKDWNQHNTETEPESNEEDDEESAMNDVFGNGTGDSGDDSDDTEDSSDISDGSNSKSNKKNSKDKDANGEDDGNAESDENKKNGKKLVTAEEAEQMAKEMKKFNAAATDKPQKGCGNEHRIIRDAFEMFNEFNNAELKAKLAKIILMANKKKGYYSNSRRTYNNGRIGPRNIVENDYKWFNDKGRNNNKAYSKIHFNLFIDNSGSWSADLEVNQFIRALNEIKSTDFDFDVITINCDIVEWPTSDAYVFRSGGGTNLSNAIAPIIKKHTLPGCQNYNIVVFDGDAHGSCDAANEPFRHFNTTNSILVVDESNAQFIKNLNSCKKQIIKSNYSQHFIAAVLELLERTLC